jgi:hypothetical protein
MLQGFDVLKAAVMFTYVHTYTRISFSPLLLLLLLQLYSVPLVYVQPLQVASRTTTSRIFLCVPTHRIEGWPYILYGTGANSGHSEDLLVDPRCRR